jgi:phosphoglycolate phosphatase
MRVEVPRIVGVVRLPLLACTRPKVNPPTPNLRFRSVIFDFDFTLADSSNGIFDCVNKALAAMGAPLACRDDVHATIGLSLRETFTRLTGSSDSARQAEFMAKFYSRAEVVMVDSAVLYEYVPAAIREIQRRGILLGMATTKQRVHVEAILKREGLADAFQTVIGGNDVSHQKPHPESLLAGLKALGVSPQECLYVGDSAVDAEAAQRAAVPFVAVLTGVTKRAAFDAFPARAILNHVGELPAWLEATQYSSSLMKQI